MLDSHKNALDSAHTQLDEALVRATLTTLFNAVAPLIASTEFRLVGTSATLLRGISLPAADIDLLFKRRDDLDRFDQALTAEDKAITLVSPAPIPGAAQYFSKYLIDQVVVEFSTVEVEVDAELDCFEAVGTGPWRHYENLVCGPYQVPTVATELRLLTELRRNRPEKYTPILQYFRTAPCDVPLVKRGMATIDLPEAFKQEIFRAIEQTQG